MPEITVGLYKHYKGREYEVVAVARHSETEELMVVYRACYDAGDIWVRPLSMFEEDVETERGRIPRFEPVARQ